MRLLVLIRKDKYYILLAIQLLFMLILPFLPLEGDLTSTFIIISLSMILLAGMNLLDHQSRLYKAGLITTLLFIVINTFLQFQSYPLLYFFSFLMFFALFLLVVINIINMLLKAQQIKPSFIAGSIAGYLMIGISFSFFIIVFNTFEENLLSKPIVEMGFHGIMYYAFITMTTIGYGEITPVEPVVQTASVLIGITSQFYMAVVVAVIVGKLMNSKSE